MSVMERIKVRGGLESGKEDSYSRTLPVPITQYSVPSTQTALPEVVLNRECS